MCTSVQLTVNDSVLLLHFVAASVTHTHTSTECKLKECLNEMSGFREMKIMIRL